MKSQAEKSGFINITYDKPNLKTDKNRVLFYVYNDRLQEPKYEMSYLDSVLLPQSSDDFTIWLAAQNGNFTVTIKASGSVVNMIFSVAALFAVMVSVLIF